MIKCDSILFLAGYFTDKLGVDMSVMREGIRKARTLAISDSFVKYTGEEIFPGAHVQSDEELDDYIRNVRNAL